MHVSNVKWFDATASHFHNQNYMELLDSRSNCYRNISNTAKRNNRIYKACHSKACIENAFTPKEITSALITFYVFVFLQIHNANNLAPLPKTQPPEDLQSQFICLTIRGNV